MLVEKGNRHGTPWLRRTVRAVRLRQPPTLRSGGSTLLTIGPPTTNTHGDWGKVSGGPSAVPMSHNLTDQSPAVLGVKPAFEDADAGGFLAFPPAPLKAKSSPTLASKKRID